ncbi:XPG domain containing-domain-containing protein [Pseudomassariella vexata]|uniref:XPG domain containing-domain-containing protein n=1 Tax=Pseudomassariella vexata TaxID=1141098 RepID=A0A1Y2E1U9_9PEZI|nr:XPG domain containing-domain-containing protein [Pseudomassariella vexata]ORY65502.1 XPG domain containing-domain-containing protein [Pseudomassariella vexata]
MGVQGLYTALKPFGVVTPLSGETVVIDGPGLVHRMWETSNKTQTNKMSSAITCHIPYASLGQTVIHWLDTLRANNVNVRKIYFDGYLPPRKWDTRRQRLIQSSRQMKNASFNTHVVHRPAQNPIVTTASDGSQQPAPGVRSLPKHPFLVPAVIEQLRQSPDWRSKVQVVPGEADAYCAQDVKKSGGIVMTSDSDLYIEDLGPTGAVVFFSGIYERHSDLEAMTGEKFSRTAFEEKNELTQCGGLPMVAYELSVNKLSMKEAIQHAKMGYAQTLGRESYQWFLEEHMSEEYIAADHPVLATLSNLDPRISEFVIQSLNIEVVQSEPVKTSQRGTPRGPEELSMFLPIMIEQHTRKSSWSMSESVRQLAYGLIQSSEPGRREQMIEYRTMDTLTGGRKLTIPPPYKVATLCDTLLATLEALSRDIETPGFRWIAFAVHQDMEWSIWEEKTPISSTLIQNAVRYAEGPEPDTVSWAVVHFVAQAQASLYSLRMLKQILAVVATLSPEKLTGPMQELREHLSTLPNIAEYPTVASVEQTLAQFGEAGGLFVVSALLGIPMQVLPKPPVTQTMGSRAQKATAKASNKRSLQDSKGQNEALKQKKARESPAQAKRSLEVSETRDEEIEKKKKPRRPLSLNPYALLSEAALEE